MEFWTRLLDWAWDVLPEAMKLGVIGAIGWLGLKIRNKPLEDAKEQITVAEIKSQVEARKEIVNSKLESYNREITDMSLLHGEQMRDIYEKINSLKDEVHAMALTNVSVVTSVKSMEKDQSEIKKMLIKYLKK